MKGWIEVTIRQGGKTTEHRTLQISHIQQVYKNTLPAHGDSVAIRMIGDDYVLNVEGSLEQIIGSIASAG